jgi:hypothetical protein
MVTPVLQELASLSPPLPYREAWFLPGHITQRLMTAWDQICQRITQTGSAESLHAIRDDYQATLLGYLKILDGYLAVMSFFPGDQPDGLLLNRFKTNRYLLQKHYDSLFPRWQGLEDLEAILLERISISNDQLKELATKYPPPPVWYNETDDQLTSE